jgi:hypothetical protein
VLNRGPENCNDRPYLFRFAGTKQSGTRTTRIEQAMPAIFEGLGFQEWRDRETVDACREIVFLTAVCCPTPWSVRGAGALIVAVVFAMTVDVESTMLAVLVALGVAARRRATRKGHRPTFEINRGRLKERTTPQHSMVF